MVAFCLNPSHRTMKMQGGKGNNARMYEEEKGDFCILNVQSQSVFKEKLPSSFRTLIT